MRKLLVFCLAVMASGVYAQTLYIPSGTAGIGSSSTGNVGIGLSAPTTQLHINGALRINGAAGGPIGAGARIEFATSTNTFIEENWGLNLTGADQQPVKIRNAALLVGYTSNSTSFGTSGNLLVQGNTGIGTTSPAAKLHVATPATSGISIFESTGNTNSWISIKNSVATLNMGIASSSVTAGFAYAYSSSGKFMIGADGNPTMTVSGMTNGNVGIGTVNPDQKLTVNGIIHASEVRIDLSVPGPDYVFEKDYALPTLEQIKTYIDANKHLPEVPSAKEMEKDGVKLGEMNMILLKKVEELTLYMLEMKKEIETLKGAQQSKK